jgi:hypothetical protein
MGFRTYRRRWNGYLGSEEKYDGAFTGENDSETQYSNGALPTDAKILSRKCEI